MSPLLVLDSHCIGYLFINGLPTLIAGRPREAVMLFTVYVPKAMGPTLLWASWIELLFITRAHYGYYTY